MLGRTLGFVFTLPFAYFGLRGQLRRRLVFRMFGMFGLGLCQGMIGWWMVRSGLESKPDYHTSPKVSVYRIFVHLNMAMIIFSFLLWNSLTLLMPATETRWTASSFQKMRTVRKSTLGIVGLLGLNIASGAIVAGLDAGKVFNTWPLMNGSFLPGGYWRGEKGINNLFENMATVQFNHRSFAYLTYTASTCKLLPLHTHLPNYNSTLLEQCLQSDTACPRKSRTYRQLCSCQFLAC